MIIPYIAAVMRDVFEQTPVMMKESAYGIGCTTGKSSGASCCRSPKRRHRRRDVEPGPRAGETMAVTFIIGNTYQLDSASLYMPGNSITSALANEFAEAESGVHRRVDGTGPDSVCYHLYRAGAVETDDHASGQNEGR